ncbi:MAG: hypothetical protein LBB89_03170 [Treponema sp.]|jgi:hypothetical protein|nr:hypothetical protein [Treponema sp.]
MKRINIQFAKIFALVFVMIMCADISNLQAQNRFTPTVADSIGIVVPPKTTEQLIWAAYLVSWAETYQVPGGGTFLSYLDLPAQIVDKKTNDIVGMVQTIYDMIVIVANQEGKTPYEFITYLTKKMKFQQRDRFYFRLFEWGKLSGLFSPLLREKELADLKADVERDNPSDDYNNIEKYLSVLTWSEDQWKK